MEICCYGNTYIRSQDVSRSSPNKIEILPADWQFWLLLATLNHCDGSTLSTILWGSHDHTTKPHDTPTCFDPYFLPVQAVQTGNHGYQTYVTPQMVHQPTIITITIVAMVTPSNLWKLHRECLINLICFHSNSIHNYHSIDTDYSIRNIMDNMIHQLPQQLTMSVCHNNYKDTPPLVHPHNSFYWCSPW